MSDLKKLYADTESKGMAWASVDSDEDAKTADEFRLREHVPWPNHHDQDGSLGRAYQRQEIPLGVVFAFYEPGYEISELRAAIANLGPQFSAVALSTKPTE
jgi:hypothetical protein